jgi:hypothetical protein
MDRTLLAPGRQVLSLALVCLALTGCGSKVEISGSLTKKGQPFQPPEKVKVNLVFVPEKEGAGPSVPAAFAGDQGTYSVQLPAGHYRAQLILVDITRPPPNQIHVRPEFSKAVHDLTASKTLDLEIGP